MSIRRHLERSASGSEFVRVIRRGRHLDKLDGVVVPLGRKWLAMALDDDAGFDGFAVIRSRDVCRVEPLNNGRFLRDSWALQGHWPVPYVGDVVLERTREMLPGLSRLFPVLTVHYEYDDPHACLIGVPLRCRRHSFTSRPSAPMPSGTSGSPRSGTARSAGSMSQPPTRAGCWTWAAHRPRGRGEAAAGLCRAHPGGAHVVGHLHGADPAALPTPVRSPGRAPDQAEGPTG